VQWQFIELLGIKELFDQEITSGTEVDWKLFERIDKLKEKAATDFSVAAFVSNPENSTSPPRPS
jgi:hypothetical protein